MTGTVVIKRVYEPAEPSDGYRVLVDRLWPRGVSKERAELDLWLKEVAPSMQLRTEWGHDPARFAWFTQAYRTELAHNSAVGQLRELTAKHAKVTLLFADHDPEINNAAVLRDFLAGSE